MRAEALLFFAGGGAESNEVDFVTGRIEEDIIVKVAGRGKRKR